MSAKDVLKNPIVTIILPLLLVILYLYHENTKLSGRVYIWETFGAQQYPQMEIGDDSAAVAQPRRKIPRPTLCIEHPTDSSSVKSMFDVQGTTRRVHADLWVIVHPVSTPFYRVASKAQVLWNGSWTAQVCDDTLRTMGSTSIKVMALSLPEIELLAGQVLSGWPEAQIKSDVVTLYCQ